MNEERRALICAYNDGELDERQAKIAEDIVGRNIEARQYLETLQKLDQTLQSAFSPILNEPVPSRIHAVLQSAQRRSASRYFAYAAIAASLVLVAVFVIRQDLADQRMQDKLAQMQREIAMLRHQALENTPSGSAMAWVEPAGTTRAEITPLKSYRTKNNRFCREYEERIEDAAGVEIRRGIACRQGKGHWPDLAPDMSRVPRNQRQLPAKKSKTGSINL